MFQVNGRSYSEQKLTVQQFLEQENYNLSYVAIELNGNILPRRLYTETYFMAGDKVEIVSFVGGG